MSSITPVKPKEDISYPDSDGRPMGETPLHVLNFRWTLDALELFFATDPMVFIAGNMFVYYEKGNRHRHLSPDVFVVRGIPKVTTPARRSYFLWENKPIDFVLELTSSSTKGEDIDDKKDLYCNVLQVQEYFLFDPYAEYLDPPLQGFHLSGGQYVPIQPVANRVSSNVLGLHLEADGEMLRLYNPQSQSWLPYPPELDARRQAAEAAAELERKARQAVAAEAERLRQENEELRRQLGKS